ncbi:NADH-quinone oxidoreductase subunit C [Streptomyces iakyrus]|uniref:NADH-quinone oxidoreductase subunit C n=1 Tax=Streptomyces iakyrus TaxID=68219 RepID=UPI0005241ECE|nr:NADH-quinone oxidoreductase subunit C [Streptomyces iakyrus]
MTAVGWLPSDAEELFGPDATAEESYEVLTVDVPPASWITALETARDRLGCTYFDWLSAVDEPGTGFRVSAHVAALSPLRRLLVRTTVPHEAPVLPSAVGVYAGAAWHERETYEMFGITFEGHPALDHLLLPENFEGHPLRKDFVLAARVAKAWPGAKEPGESEHGGPKRRQMLPPGVPDPNEWGPLKGQLPPAPARPARGAARAAGERPVRRTRSASGGSASQAAAGTEAPAVGPATSAAGVETPAAGAGTSAAGGEAPVAGADGSASVRRSRSAAEGSASQSAAGAQAPAAARRSRSAAEGSASQSPPGEPTAPAPTGPRRNRSVSEGSVSQGAVSQGAANQQPSGDRTSASPGSESAMPGSESEAPTSEPPTPGASAPSAGPRRARSVSEGSASQRAGSDRGDSRPGRTSTTARGSDAPWHHARPAFDEPAPEPSPEAAQLPDPEPSNGSQASEPAGAPEPSGDSKAAPDAPASPDTDTSENPDTPEEPAGGPR